MTVGLSSNSESIGYLDAARHEFTIHLTERGVFPADERNVGHANLTKPTDKAWYRHSIPCIVVFASIVPTCCFMGAKVVPVNK